MSHTCPGYEPRFVKQLDGSALGGSNCTCASAAMAADDDSCGAIKLSSSQVRAWTGDTSGGTNLAQMDYVLRRHVNVDLDVRYRLPWSEFMRLIRQGRGAILQGWYAPIRDSRFRGSETFGGNHAIYVSPGLIVEDPLADGRRPGIYRYHGEAYPESLLRNFAGRLNVGSTSYARLGDGLCYAAFTRDNEPNYRAVVHPAPPAKTISYFVYTVKAGAIVARRTETTTGFSVASCTAPRLYGWPTHKPPTSVSLIQLLTGSKKGQFINAKFAREMS